MARQIVRIDGLKDLDKALTELKKSTARNVLKSALTDSAKPVEDDAKARVRKKSGALARSLHFGPVSQLNKSQRRTHRKLSDVEVLFGASGLPHAHLIEFGTAHSRAFPFLRPAWDGNADGVLKRLIGILTNKIEAARARAARKAEREAAKLAAGK